MLKNYFKIAWRNLVKNKAYSAINIIGLGMGMAIAVMISLWIADELSFDTYHENHKHLAQVMVTQVIKSDWYTGPTIAMPLGQALRTKYKDSFKRLALVSYPGDHILALGDKKISASGIWAQDEFPKMFTFHMARGDASSLKDPSTILIAQSLATALFGDADPVNKTILLDNELNMKVGGVYEDLPHNTTFYDTRILLPWMNKNNHYMNSNTDWNDHNGELFVQLADNTDAVQTTAKIKNTPTPFIKQYREEVMVQPLDKLHLYDEFKKGMASGGRIQFVWLFGIIGAFVLLLACINFMNLSTARSEKRAREVGIRKTVGSRKGQLIGQFFSESLLVAFLSFLISLLIVQACMPFYNILAGKHMTIPWNSPLFWLLALGFTLFTGILSGSYPAFYLSSFQPIKVLKGPIRTGRYASLPRQILVVLQFTVSLTLIIGTFVVYRQIEVGKDRPVGYSKEGLITVWMQTPELYGHYEALRNDLLQTGVVDNMAESSQATTGFGNNNDLSWRGKDPSLVLWFRNVNVTRDFGKTIDWTVLRGRDFSRSYGSDSSAMILNEKAAKDIGIKDPVGEVMKFGGKEYTVIGVVKDMLTNAPYDSIEPAIFLGDGYMAAITIRIKAGQSVHKALAGIATVFKKYSPGTPFAYSFNDDEYARKFEDEERISNLAAVFASLAIFISCLGLFGLASFVAEQRKKEIGVRKVLGATLLSLWGLLSTEFVKLVALSLFIAIPLSYYVMHQWLQNYKYQTDLPWWVFAGASVGILTISLLTVSYQSLKAATMNPVKSLRTE